MSHAEEALLYAEQVCRGEIPACKLTVLACQRFIDDLERSQTDWPYYFDLEAANKSVNFAELMPHTKGRWAAKKQTLKAEPFQKFFFCNIFGWKHKETHLRRFREVYCKMPRKNGKSFLAAAVGNKMFVNDGEFGAEVYSGATTEKQAWEVFRPAKLMVERSETFKNKFDIEVNAKNMCVLQDGSRFEPLVGNPGDGSSPSCAIVDEYHEHATDDLFETMNTGMGSREQPLMLVITTAGSNMGGPCYEKEQDCIKVLENPATDESVFVLIYGTDEDDAWDDPETLKKANPNFGISVSEDYLLRQLNTAKRSASKQNIFRTKHLNQWVGARTAWMNMLAWRRQQKDKLEQFKDAPCYMAVDLASRVDVAALVLVFKQGEQFFSLEKYYAPESAAENNDKYQTFANSGELVLTPGNKTDQAFIEEDIKALCKEYEVQQIAFDDWQADYMMTRLMECSLPVVNYNQTVKNMSSPMKELEAVILDGNFWHKENACTTWMMGNVVARIDAKENIYPRKENEADKRCKIDGVVALIMAMGLSMSEEEDTASPWENEDFKLG